LKLQELRVLMSVVEAGSMSKAATALATSQPAISRAIADLEHSLGVRLLDRDSQGIVPTPYGQALLKRSIAAFDELKLGIQDVKSLSDPDSGEVRVAVALAFVTGFVPAVIAALGRRYPRIVCRLATSESTEVLQKLEDREADLVILFLSPEAVTAQMQTEILFELNPLVVVAGERNPLTRRQNIALADLMKEPWALTQPEGDFSYSRVFRAAGFEPPSPAVIADSLPMRLELASGGRFLTILPGPVLRFAGQGLALKVLPIPLPASRYYVGLVTLKNRTLTAAAQRFIECAREVAKTATIRKPPGPRRRTA
jgi:DNA-binding transcriptional LysR family regulator